MGPIYLFSGIGADHRAFQKLDLSGYQVTYIDWLSVEGNEAIEHYAKRLLDQITSPKPILIGLSFGGIMAAEVAKLIEVEKIILIASVKTCHELPPSVKLNLIPFYKILPGWLLVRPNFIVNWLFGTESKSDRKLLADILHDTDPNFVKWALDKITHWKNERIHPHTIHIHGTADRLFPFKYIKGAIPVTGGGHLMTVNRSLELSGLIRRSI